MRRSRRWWAWLILQAVFVSSLVGLILGSALALYATGELRWALPLGAAGLSSLYALSLLTRPSQWGQPNDAATPDTAPAHADHLR